MAGLLFGLLLQLAGPVRVTADRALAAAEAGETLALEREWRRAAPRDLAAIYGLATLARLRYDYGRADSLYLVLGRRTEPAAADFRRQAAIDRASAFIAQGNYAAGDSVASAAIALASADSSMAQLSEALLVRVGTVLRQRGRVAAESLLSQADSIRPPGDSVLLVRALCTRAQVGLARAVPGVAGPAVEGAELAARHGWHRLQASCQLQQALRWEQQGYIDTAAAYLSRIGQLQRAARDWNGLATVLQRRGYMLLSRGRLLEARDDAENAIRMGQLSRNQSVVAWAHLNLSRLTAIVGDRAAAALHLAIADSMVAESGDGLARMTVAYAKVAIAWTAGDRETARRLGAEFRRSAEPFGDRWLVDAFRWLGLVAREQREWTRAAAYFDSAAAIAARSRMEGMENWIAGARTELAFAEGRYAEAERQLTVQVGRMTPGSPSYRAAILLALSRFKTGRAASAESVLVAAGDAVDRWRADLADQDLRRAVFDLRYDGVLEAPLVAALIELGRAGRDEIAFQLAERRRARQLDDQLVAAQGFVPEPRQLARRGRGAGPVPSLELPDDSTGLLEFAVSASGGEAAGFVVTRRGITLVPLGPAPDLGGRIARYVGLLSAGDDARVLASGLGRELMAPLLARLPPTVTRIVLVPDGPLHALPFETLRLANGDAVGARFSVAIAPSAAVWQRLRARVPILEPARILALGDPEPPALGVETSLRAAVGATGGLPRLPAARAEAIEVARWGTASTIRVGREASEHFLRTTALDRFQVIHLATHAVVSDWSLDGTALMLAPGDGHDGIVRPADLAALGLKADLVVLSGCRTALGVVSGGEGVLGLTTSLLEAGARAVLASRWPVGDRATLDFARRFYREMARGSTVGDAVATVGRQLASAGRPAREWAAFELVGDPTVRLTLRRLNLASTDRE